MYESFFGIEAQPFDVTPNPKYLLDTPTHREALHMLEYGVRARKGIILLLGDAGTGKTTLLRKALALRLFASAEASEGQGDGDGQPAEYVYIKNPRLATDELFEQLASGFKLPATAILSKPRFLKLLEDALVASHVAGRSPALIVDEAQALSDELVEELRLLANIESDDTKLLPLILAGQPELADRLNQHQLRQFKQRITLRCELRAFRLPETATYIFGRVRVAGGDASKMFTRDAVVAIHDAAKGIPRTINVICDNALLTAFALERCPVDEAIVDEVCRDLDLGATFAEAPAAKAGTAEAPAAKAAQEASREIEVRVRAEGQAAASGGPG